VAGGGTARHCAHGAGDARAERGMLYLVVSVVLQVVQDAARQAQRAEELGRRLSQLQAERADLLSEHSLRTREADDLRQTIAELEAQLVCPRLVSSGHVDPWLLCVYRVKPQARSRC